MTEETSIPAEAPPALATNAELAALDHERLAIVQERLQDLTLPTPIRESLMTEGSEIRGRIAWRGETPPDVGPTISRESPRGKEPAGINIHIDPHLTAANKWKPE